MSQQKQDIMRSRLHEWSNTAILQEINRIISYLPRQDHRGETFTIEWADGFNTQFAYTAQARATLNALKNEYELKTKNWAAAP